MNQTVEPNLNDSSLDSTSFKFLAERQISILKATKLRLMKICELFCDIQYGHVVFSASRPKKTPQISFDIPPRTHKIKPPNGIFYVCSARGS